MTRLLRSALAAVLVASFVAPAAALLSLPFVLHFSLAVLDDPALAVSVLAHPWHGRAPPQA